MKTQRFPSLLCLLIPLCLALLGVAFFSYEAHLRLPAQSLELQQSSLQQEQQRLLFYNRPPKTGSTSVRFAMKAALDDAGLTSAKCFNRIEWNEMGLRTIINRRQVDFYGCHTRMFDWRFTIVSNMRAGNVVFMTSTRRANDIVLSAYLQQHRERDVLAIRGESEIAKEVQQYKAFVKKYPVNALYMYHGAGEELTTCPVQWRHIEAMRRIAERYEIIIDLERPEESAAMVQIVTGLRPNFNIRMNERTTEDGPMLRQLRKVNTSSVSCGNELVHQVLMQQFNIIKDRLMQNRCFDEDSGTFELCEIVALKRGSLVERNRNDSIDEKIRLENILQSRKQPHN